MPEGDHVRGVNSGQKLRPGKSGLPVADGPCRYAGCKLRDDPAAKVLEIDPEAFRGMLGNDLVDGYRNNHDIVYFVDVPRGVTEVVILPYDGETESFRFYKSACVSMLYQVLRPEVFAANTAEEKSHYLDTLRNESWKKESCYTPCNELLSESEGK